MLQSLKLIIDFFFLERYFLPVKTMHWYLFLLFKVVIKLEGGLDSDLVVLDCPPTPPPERRRSSSNPLMSPQTDDMATDDKKEETLKNMKEIKKGIFYVYYFSVLKILLKQGKVYLGICNRISDEAQAGAKSYWKHCRPNFYLVFLQCLSVWHYSLVGISILLRTPEEVDRYLSSILCMKSAPSYHIFSVIRRSIFSKKFCLITFELSQIRGASYSQVFSCSKIQECPIL